jgi:hypothetical protein
MIIAELERVTFVKEAYGHLQTSRYIISMELYDNDYETLFFIPYKVYDNESNSFHIMDY